MKELKNSPSDEPSTKFQPRKHLIPCDMLGIEDENVLLAYEDCDERGPHFFVHGFGRNDYGKPSNKTKVVEFIKGDELKELITLYIIENTEYLKNGVQVYFL